MFTRTNQIVAFTLPSDPYSSSMVRESRRSLDGYSFDFRLREVCKKLEQKKIY